jgi:hypothetical protein
MSGINSGLIRLVCMTKNRSKEEGDAAEAAMIEDISLGLKDQIFTECLIDITPMLTKNATGVFSSELGY